MPRLLGGLLVAASVSTLLGCVWALPARADLFELSGTGSDGEPVGLSSAVVQSEPGAVASLSPAPVYQSAIQTNGADEKRVYAPAAVEHFNRGVEFSKSGKFKQATAEYKAAIAADNRIEEAYSNLGTIYAAQGNHSRAIDSFTTALVLKPSRPTTLNALGAVLFERGRVNEAKEMWKRAITIDSMFASAHYNMGVLLEKEQDLIGARMAYAKAVSLDAQIADAQERLAKIPGGTDRAEQQSPVIAESMRPITLDSGFAPSGSASLGAPESDSGADFEDGSLKLSSSLADSSQGRGVVELVPYAQQEEPVSGLLVTSQRVTPQQDRPTAIASESHNMFLRLPQ